MTAMQKISYTLNVPQALFGATLGMWYGVITRSVLESKVGPALEDVRTYIIKGLYIIASLVFFAVFAFVLTQYQKRLYALLNKAGEKIHVSKIIASSWKGLWILIFITLTVWAFLYTTFLVFTLAKIDIYYLIYGGFQLIVWIVLEIGIFARQYVDLENEKIKEEEAKNQILLKQGAS